MNDTKILHRVIRRLAELAVWSFFTELHVIGAENVPQHGPIIVTSTHHNMMLDPAVLSTGFPYRRIMNYWSKATLFANPIMSYVLYSSGNIPVDRKSKDRQILFKGTFEALSKGLAVALFPEGTSYTEPRIMQIKDGAAWAALEYTKWLIDNPDKSTAGVVIVPAAIVYTNKSKYRSDVILEFGAPISMDEYKEQFLSGVDGDARSAAKRLSRTIESRLVEATINAPDWDTLYTARMARDLLWQEDKSINLDEFVLISQTLVDLFSTADVTPNFTSVQRKLLEYYSLLQTTHLTNSVLSALPLPRTLDPKHPTPLPSRLHTLALLIGSTVSSLLRLPFFIFPLVVHAPVYALARLGARLVQDEEETQAQNKVVVGLLLLLLIYPTAFFVVWAFLWYTPTGALLAGAIVWMFALSHNKLINANYEHAKRLIATWRVLIGLWQPRRWELSLSALSQYTTPVHPKESEWIDHKEHVRVGTGIPPATKMTSPVVVSEPPVKLRRPPSRRIMRHVLRARVEAMKALASFFEQLEGSGARAGKEVKASVHLARAFGGIIDKQPNDTAIANAGDDFTPLEQGWRSATEVVAFLRKRGAHIPTLGQSRAEGEWAAWGSDGDNTPTEEKTEEEALVFVAPGSHS